MHIFKTNIVIFNFLCLLNVSDPMVHLQEGGCTCNYGIVFFTCIGIGSLVGGSVFVTDCSKIELDS
jgi:hypothetical protein